jgi:formylglycine-generating enzyme required for sulfatase activity
MAHDVFISYRREGGPETARVICEALRGRGLKVFLDVDDLGASHFDESLLREIEESPNFIVILSPGCLDRCNDENDWLRREIANAIKTEKNIVPIMKEGFVFPQKGILPDEISSLPRHNAVKYYHEYFDATIDKLTKFLKVPAEESGGGLRVGRGASALSQKWKASYALIAIFAMFVLGGIGYWSYSRGEQPQANVVSDAHDNLPATSPNRGGRPQTTAVADVHGDLPATPPIATSASDEPEPPRSPEEPKSAIESEHLQTMTNSIGMRMALIPAGSFMMGSPEDERQLLRRGSFQHGVNITKPFYMGITEVTQAQWKAVMGRNPSNFKGDDLPAESVNWNDVQEFIAKLNEREGGGYRLPTEAEWEYVCRAGSSTRYFFGDDKSRLGDFAWYKKNSGGKTHPVGQRKPNAWGLYDVHGNVSEWCSDWYDSSYYQRSPTDDPKGPTSGTKRIVRGGLYHSPSASVRSAHRGFQLPNYTNARFGFRCVRDVPG